MMNESLTQKAYREIRRLILRLDLAPGSFLNEGELQERLGIGRTPVREAIQRLTREQLLAVVPRRGLYVTDIKPDELPMLYETRATLEPYITRLAARRGLDRHWDEMGAIIESAPVVHDDGDLMEIDRRCHELTWEAADNRYLTDTLDMLYAQSERLWYFYLADVTDMRSAVDEHAEIFDALRSGDGDTAAALAEAHVRSFDAQVRQVLRKRSMGS